MSEQILTYEADGTSCKGFLAMDEAVTSPRPAVIVMHAFRGQDDFARDKARDLAKLGYVGFAADVYGDAKEVGIDEAYAMMMPYFLDRKLLRERITAAYDAIVQVEGVDKNRIGVIGFCFGGLCVIELLRSGKKLSGAVSFHGLLGNALGDQQAKMEPSHLSDGSILVLHGHNDPLTSDGEIAAFQKEMTDAGVDWQMHIYGHASHAFTNPMANAPEHGLLYNPIADKRSWLAMQNYFQEVFSL